MRNIFSFNLVDEAICRTLKSLPVHHVYGQGRKGIETCLKCLESDLWIFQTLLRQISISSRIEKEEIIRLKQLVIKGVINLRFDLMEYINCGYIIKLLLWG